MYLRAEALGVPTPSDSRGSLFSFRNSFFSKFSAAGVFSLCFVSLLYKQTFRKPSAETSLLDLCRGKEKSFTFRKPSAEPSLLELCRGKGKSSKRNEETRSRAKYNFWINLRIVYGKCGFALIWQIALRNFFGSSLSFFFDLNDIMTLMTALSPRFHHEVILLSIFQCCGSWGRSSYRCG